MKKGMKAIALAKKRFCPKCGFELKSRYWKMGMYKCPLCGLSGTRKQTIRTPKPKVWKGEYDEEYLRNMGYDIMTGPEANDLVGHRGFRSNAWLITDEEDKDSPILIVSIIHCIIVLIAFT